MARTFMLLLLPVLVAYASGPSGCCTMNVTVVAGEAGTFPGGGVTGRQADSIEYSSSVVEAEYIVMFVSYYTTEARAGFISAALRPHPHWSIVARPNPAADYPSDFSVVRLDDRRGTHSVTKEKEGVVTREAALQALTHHPAVRRVTPQKRLTNMLAASECKLGA